MALVNKVELIVGKTYKVFTYPIDLTEKQSIKLAKESEPQGRFTRCWKGEESETLKVNTPVGEDSEFVKSILKKSERNQKTEPITSAPEVFEEY